LTLAEQGFGSPELTDDLFGGIAFSGRLTSLQYLILALQLDQFWGAGQIGGN
jgi:hypothetical protein